MLRGHEAYLVAGEAEGATDPEHPKADNKDWLTGHDESGSAQPPIGDPLAANSGGICNAFLTLLKRDWEIV